MTIQSETTRGQEKRGRILAAAHDAFLANGFHATSMQDLLKATNMSPGAFYRYFPSKTALVTALADDAINRLASTIKETIGSNLEHVSDALMPAIFAIDHLERTKGGARLALLVWAEAQRDRELAEVIAEALRPMLVSLYGLASALLRRGIVVGKSYEPSDVAVVLAGLIQGYVVQCALFGTDPSTFGLGLGAVTRRHAA